MNYVIVANGPFLFEGFIHAVIKNARIIALDGAAKKRDIHSCCLCIRGQA